MSELHQEEAAARALGVSLLDASRVYEDFRIPSTQGPFWRRTPFPPHRRAIIGLAGRQRRLLRAANTLADEGLVLEALGPLRSMLEFLVCQRWLSHDPDRNWKLWFLADHRRRRVWREHLLENAPALHAAVLAGLTSDQLKEAAEIQAAIRRVELDLAEPNARMPKWELMAREVGLRFVYDTGYRFESSVAVHPMMFGVDVFLEPTRGGLVLRREPTKQFPAVPVYLQGATLLANALEAAGDEIPALRLDDLPAITSELRSLVEQSAKAREPNWREVIPPGAFEED